MDLFTAVKKSIEGRLGHEITRRTFFNDILGTVAGSSLLSLPGIRSLANESPQESLDPVGDVVSPDDGDWPIHLVGVDYTNRAGTWGLGISVKWESGRYWYHISDDFGDPGSMHYDLSRKSSTRPLTLGALIDLMQTSRCIEQAKEYSGCGIIEGTWKMDWEAGSPDRIGLNQEIYSVKYPELAAWYEQRLRQWCLKHIEECYGIEPLCMKNEAGETIPSPDLVDSVGAQWATELVTTPNRSFDLQWRPASYHLDADGESEEKK